MKYVEWCEKVLIEFGRESRRNSIVLERGLYEQNLEKLVLDDKLEEFKSFVKSDKKVHKDPIFWAVFDFRKIGLIEKVSNPHYRLTRNGLIAAENLEALWEYVCSPDLQPDVEETLRLVNDLSEVPEENENENFAWTEYVSMNNLVNRSGSRQAGVTEKEIHDRLRILQNYGLVFFEDGHYVEDVRATYAGLAWEQRREKVQGVKELKDLLAEGETTSVEFKAELYLDTKGEKAEFVKDALGLVNTQASGRRWMIIGIDDKTRELYVPHPARVNDKNYDWYQKTDKDRIEQTLSPYVKPNLEIRFSLIDYKTGKVGKLEFIREPKKVPYKVAQDLGDKNAPGSKKERQFVEEGKIFVRHGTHTVEPDDDELQDLYEEARRANLN